MKYFISHSSKNACYGEEIVQLLINLGVPSDKIIFTSKSGFGIPKGENIFDWLKNQIEEKPFVIYLLSDEYYSSVACLNEMGAAWIVENKHITLFTPKFNMDDPKFKNGAIDPRKMGVFIDDQNDILEFAELILNNENQHIKPVILANNVTNFINSINKHKNNKNDVTNNTNFDRVDHNNTNNLPKKDHINNNLHSKFIEYITQKKLSDEELLLINYMIDLGTTILGDRWKAEDEIRNICNWEEINNLTNYLSNNYDAALNKLKLRKFIEVYSLTSYENPREYVLIEDISSQLLDFPEEVHKALSITRNKYQKKEVDTMDLPF